MDIETDEMKKSIVELNQRQTTQLEELELLRGNLNQMSQRSRNHSSDRPGQLGFQEPRIKTKPNEASRQSQSVEKFLNLKQSNQNVDNLINAWKQQKNSISLNNSMNTSIPQVIQETPEYESPALKTPQIVVEVDEYDDDHMMKSQQQVKLNNNVKISSRYPNTTRTNLTNQKKEKMNISNPTPTPTQKTKTTNRPQTSKAPPTLKKTSTTTITTKNQNHMKTSLVETPHQMKSSMEESSFCAQTPTYKSGKTGGSLLEKQRNLKIQQQQQQKSNKKIQAASQQQQEERQLIQQISKLKEQVLKCYENGQILHSQNVISKNFDQIINIMKLDFKCLENND